MYARVRMQTLNKKKKERIKFVRTLNVPYFSWISEGRSTLWTDVHVMRLKKINTNCGVCLNGNVNKLFIALACRQLKRDQCKHCFHVSESRVRNVIYKRIRDLLSCLHGLILTLGRLGKFSTSFSVTQTWDAVEGLLCRIHPTSLLFRRGCVTRKVFYCSMIRLLTFAPSGPVSPGGPGGPLKPCEERKKD